MQHPDEGTIHTWLDGALPDEEARAIESHVASCASCAALVAEARGLSARASRILGALDDVPASVVPARSRSPRTVQTPWWRKPGVAAAAAIAIVATGTMMAVTRDWGSRSSPRMEAVSEMVLPQAEVRPADDSAPPEAAAARAPAPDSAPPPIPRRALESEVAQLKSAAATTATEVRVQQEAVESRRMLDSGSRAEASGLADLRVAAPPPSSPAVRQRVVAGAERPRARSGSVISNAVSVTGCYEFDSRGEGGARAPLLPGVVRLTDSAEVVADVAAAAQPQERAFAASSPMVVPPATDSGQPGWTLTDSDSISVRLAVRDQLVLVTFPSPAANPRLGRVAASAPTGSSEWTGTVLVRQVPCGVR
jgi:hypothetical protein